MLTSEDKELLAELEKEKQSVVFEMEEMKKSNHVCFLTFHKLKKKKKKLNSEIKKIKAKMIPDIIA